MEIAIIALLVLAVGGLTTAIVFLSKNGSRVTADTDEAYKKLLASNTDNGNLALNVQMLTADKNQLTQLILTQKADLLTEQTTRKLVENQRDALLEDLRKLGDPGAVAANIAVTATLLSQLGRKPGS